VQNIDILDQNMSTVQYPSSNMDRGNSTYDMVLHTHTHTHTHIYIYNIY